MNSNGKIIDVGLSLDQDYIKSAVENIVKAAIMQALGDPASLVKQAIDKTINTKVDSDGKPTDRSYGALPYLDYVAKKVVEDTIREKMTEAVLENAESFREEMLRQIRTKKFQQNMLASFTQSVLESAKNNWRMPITVSFEPIKD